MKTLRWSLGLLLLIPVGHASAQAQQAPPPTASSTAADAAAAKTDTVAKPKKARVWDNDNIPKAGDEISVVGQAIPDQSNSSAAPTADAGSGITPAAAPGDKDKEKKDEGAVEEGRTDKDARVAAAKEKLDSLKKDLDLAQRRLTLDSQMYYSKPDYQTDPEGAEQLKSEKDQVAAKQDEVDAAQKELDALEAELASSASN
ncbi:MAG: hypothetical protein WA823_12235 [Candidatus Acidiferrales bacterium]